MDKHSIKKVPVSTTQPFGMEIWRIGKYFVSLRQEIRIKMEENDIMIAAEPAAALLSENVRKSGLLSQVMKLSQPDKVALIAYLSKDVAKEESFKADEFGRIKLTPEMRDAVVKAERDYEDDKCFSEADFKERFAKWL
jgi:hypothetical protein